MTESDAALVSLSAADAVAAMVRGQLDTGEAVVAETRLCRRSDARRT
jgi:hypothetical protein